MAYKRVSPTPIVEGGTNATSMTNTDGVVYYDGSLLNTTTVGTLNNVLTSNGSGNAPTFQVPVATGSGWIKIATQNATTSSTIQFTSGFSGTYTTYIFVLDNVLPDGISRNLEMQLSTNGGSSYLATGYKGGTQQNNYNSATWANANTTSFLYITNQQSSVSAPGLFGVYYLHGIGTSLWPNMHGQGFIAGNNHNLSYGAYTSSALTVTAVQFLYSAGTIASGSFTMYGLVA